MKTDPDASETSWTNGRLLTWTTEYLTRHEVDEARLCAELLLAHAAGCRRIDLYARFGDVPASDVRDRFRELVRRAARHEPPAYLTGEKEFFSLAFEVGSGVLIPRPETETLVEAVVDHYGAKGLLNPRFLDVGTGSGCIAVAVLKQIPDASGWATDVCDVALRFARRNAERHGVGDRLTLCKADRLALPGDESPEGGFDLIVSNPPYIAKEAVAELDANVRGYEPVEALTDGGDGLSFYRCLASDGPGLLKPGGAVMVEVAAGRAELVVEIMAGSSLVHESTIKDRVCGHDRVLVFSLV